MVYLPLWKIWVSWDDDIPKYGQHNVPNHQPDCVDLEWTAIENDRKSSCNKQFFRSAQARKCAIKKRTTNRNTPRRHKSQKNISKKKEANCFNTLPQVFSIGIPRVPLITTGFRLNSLGRSQVGPPYPRDLRPRSLPFHLPVSQDIMD